VSENGYLEVVNWTELQHYKNRDPLWIKLYRRLQDKYEWLKLPDASKGHLVGIWILAAKLGNKVPADPAWIAERIGATEPVDLQVLITSGFLASDRDLGQIASLEKRREETEKITTTSASAVAERRAPEHTLRSCIGLVVEKLYFGNRPLEAAMRNEASIAKALGDRYGYDRLAKAIAGLARRRDTAQLGGGVGPRQALSLKWLNSKKFDINQLAASEDAFYAADPEPRRGRGKATDIAGIVASIAPRSA
jgi:hypothetical protein